ncbi:hypothetical protein E5206_06580 [Arthrobacter sp. PAMC25564]|uniref:hypothetical protein n=1 Tax=Arthrobacter sp. PAMC25564 TaxID=2565366 RepID=UPI0010A27EA4|nr:hypothetical protein [Arthrobacter sp. PAMC25564]QCB96636.1 hypothetical protein E5206_06580 [Arthrobacter sp. PAMC25564]
MITLQQDAEGFIRMKRHFPVSTVISITFNDGSSEEFSGQQLNTIYDEALAVYRAGNHLDAKGYSRAPRKTVQPVNQIEFVAVHPGMTR